MDLPEFTYNGLDKFGYRQLQKLAKSMSLPSNVKKIYLIEMLITKRFGTQDELDVLVNRVKLDRLKVSQSKWSKRKIKRAQAEVTSTSEHSPTSPPISITPKHSYVIQYSPDTTQTIIKYQPPKSYPPKRPKTCDRILRSYNTKTPRPDYAMMDDVAIYGNSGFNTKLARTTSSNRKLVGDYSIMNCASESSYNTKLARATSSNRKLASDYSIMNHASESSYNTKLAKATSSNRKLASDYSIMNHASESSCNTKLARATSSNRKRAGDFSITNHALESTYNTKIVKRVMEHRSSILDQCSSFLDEDKSFLDHRSSVKPIMDCSSSILDQSSLVLDQSSPVFDRSSTITSYKAKIMKPNLKTEIIRPNNSIVKTSYGIMDRNAVISKVVRGQNSMRVKQAIPRVEVRRESLLNSSLRVYNGEIQMRPARSTTNTSSPIPAKRKRTVSGIYPITTRGNTYYECIQTVDYRHTDGKITKINALIQKPRHPYPIMTVQDVINKKIENQIFKTSNNETTDQITKAIEHKPIITAKENTQPRQCLDLSKDFTENTQVAREYLEFSMNCTQNTQSTRDFTANSIENTLTAAKKLDFSTNNADDTQPGRQIIDFSTNCTNNTQPGRQIIDFSTSCELNTPPGRQFFDFSTDCTNNTQPGIQFIDTSSTPTYTNVMIKEMPDKGDFSVYYHKKIRSEQIRHRLNEQNEVLPHINEVFSQFNEAKYRNLTQPLYVQVSQESERFPHCPVLINNPESGSMLESLYNFRKELIVNEPLLQIATTTNTKCVFTANTVVTAEAHPSPMYNHDSSHAPVDLYNSNLEAETRLYDYMRERYHSDVSCNEVLSPTNSSIHTTNSQELGADDVTIPELVEDALELISQDGDYMERIGMDVRMHCIMCDCEWVGSQLVLEYHIRQVHQNDIIKKDSPEWSMTLTLGSLASHDIWLSHVVHYNKYLYIVSTKYIEDCIMVALTTLTETCHPKRGKITIYNKISGKPYTWESEIPYLPETMPYQCTENCLRIDIANLDLLPNSANLKLVNKELKSLGNKVVVGPPSLNNIEFVLYVQIFD